MVRASQFVLFQKDHNCFTVALKRVAKTQVTFIILFNFRAVGSPLVMDPNSICRKSRTIGGKQHEICQKQPEIVREVANGARMSIQECQVQFSHRRWNCSTTHKRSLHKIMKLGEFCFISFPKL